MKCNIKECELDLIKRDGLLLCPDHDLHLKFCAYCGSSLQERWGSLNCHNESCVWRVSCAAYEREYQREVGDGPTDYGGWEKPPKKYDEKTGEKL